MSYCRRIVFRRILIRLNRYPIGLLPFERIPLTKGSIRMRARAVRALHETGFDASDCSERGDIFDNLVVSIEDRGDLLLTYHLRRCS